MMAVMIALWMAGTKAASSAVTKAVVSAESMALSTAGEKAALMVDSSGYQQLAARWGNHEGCMNLYVLAFSRSLETFMYKSMHNPFQTPREKNFKLRV